MKQIFAQPPLICAVELEKQWASVLTIKGIYYGGKQVV